MANTIGPVLFGIIWIIWIGIQWGTISMSEQLPYEINENIMRSFYLIFSKKKFNAKILQNRLTICAKISWSVSIDVSLSAVRISSIHDVRMTMNKISFAIYFLESRATVKSTIFDELMRQTGIRRLDSFIDNKYLECHFYDYGNHEQIIIMEIIQQMSAQNVFHHR